MRIREVVRERLSEAGWSILDNHPLSLPTVASEGKNREQIRELLGAELDTRSVKMQPVEFEQNVDFLATEHKPFGHARLALRGSRRSRI